jgi:hypothetical protein
MFPFLNCSRGEVRKRKWLEVPFRSKENEDLSDEDSIADPVFDPRENDSENSSSKFSTPLPSHSSAVQYQ